MYVQDLIPLLSTYSVDPGAIHNISKDYCYQYVCSGEPKWPANFALPSELSVEMLKVRVDRECERLRALVNQEVTLYTLFRDPHIVYKCLEHISNRYED